MQILAFAIGTGANSERERTTMLGRGEKEESVVKCKIVFFVFVHCIAAATF
jgi:hypothetical protein